MLLKQDFARVKRLKECFWLQGHVVLSVGTRNIVHLGSRNLNPSLTDPG